MERIVSCHVNETENLREVHQRSRTGVPRAIESPAARRIRSVRIQLP